MGRLTQITGAGGYALRLRRINDTETILESSTGLRTVLTFDGFDGTLQTITLPTNGTPFFLIDYFERISSGMISIEI